MIVCMLLSKNAAGVVFTVDERICFGKDIVTFTDLDLDGTWVALQTSTLHQRVVVVSLEDGRCKLIKYNILYTASVLCCLQGHRILDVKLEGKSGVVGFHVWDMKGHCTLVLGFTDMLSLTTKAQSPGVLRHLNEVGKVYTFSPDSHVHYISSGGSSLRMNILPCPTPVFKSSAMSVVLGLRGGARGLRRQYVAPRCGRNSQRLAAAAAAVAVG